MTEYFLHVLDEARSSFPRNTKILVRIKDSPRNPFNSNIFNNIIINKESNSEFILYIHNEYLTITSSQMKNYKSNKILLDARLWIELYEVFNVVNYMK